MTDHLVTRNLSQIREYTKNNIELSKSHHFLYNCLVDKKENQGDVIIIGLNPGETEKDFEYRGSLPTEESSEFDFHEEHGRGRSSKNWLTLCKKFSQTNKIVLTEFFFWSSPQVGEDKERGIPFSERFGYKFEDCPHFEFCKEKNIELLEFHKPSLIMCPGVGYSELFAKIYALDYVGTFREPVKNRRAVIHYELNGIPFLFTLHWTIARLTKEETNFIIQYIGKVTKKLQS